MNTMPARLQARHAVGHHHGHAQQDEHDQRHIKPRPARVSPQNDGVQAQTPALAKRCRCLGCPGLEGAWAFRYWKPEAARLSLDHNQAMSPTRKTPRHLRHHPAAGLLHVLGFQQVLLKATVAEVPGVPGLLCALPGHGGHRRLVSVARAGRPGAAAPGLAGRPAGRGAVCERVRVHLRGFAIHLGLAADGVLASSPFWLALLLPRFIPGERLYTWQWLGLAAAFVGVGLALGDGWQAAAGAHPLAWLGDALGLAAGLMWALTTVVIRSTALARVAPEHQLLYQVAVSTALLPLLSLALGEPWSWDFPARLPGHRSSCRPGGAFASYLAWMWMLAHTRPPRCLRLCF